MRNGWILRTALPTLITAWLLSGRLPAPELPPPAAVPGTAASKLRFEEVGEDLVVRLTIEGPASRQVIFTDYTLDSGLPGWNEPPVGVAKPRRGPPQVWLRYLVLVNEDLPGYHDGGLMTPPTPPEVRRQGRQEVVWRIHGFRRLGFRQADTKFEVSASAFGVRSDQLREAVPTIQRTIAAAELIRKGAKDP